MIKVSNIIFVKGVVIMARIYSTTSSNSGLYVLGMQDIVQAKIGVTRNMRAREHSFKNANPLFYLHKFFEMDVDLAYDVERHIKKKYGNERPIKGEWIPITASDLEIEAFSVYRKLAKNRKPVKVDPPKPSTIRCHKIDGKNYYESRDIGELLKYSNISDSVISQCNESGVRRVSYEGSSVSVMDTANVYRLILSSEKDVAKPLQNFLIDMLSEVDLQDVLSGVSSLGKVKKVE